MQLFVRDKYFYKTAFLIALPIAAQQIINIGVNLMDTIMLGSFGEIQISASSLANQFYFIFHILCLGIGGGAAVMTAQYWGAQDKEAISRTMSIMHRICASIAIVLLVLTLMFPSQIMALYTEDAAVIENGARYLKILAFAYLIHGLSITTTIVLRTVRVVRLAFYATCCSFMVNVFFNWVFIFGKLGAPRLEIAGAAIGTLLARLVEFAIIFGYLLFVDRKIQYKLRYLIQKIDISILKEYMQLGVPVIISDAFLTFGNSALAMIMGRMGAQMVAANAITTVTVQISTVFIMGISNASGVITGNTIGKGEYEKAHAQGVTFLALSALIGALAGLLISLISPYIISFYNITAETREIARQLMNAVAFIVVFQSIQSVMTKGVLRGGGDTRFLMLADVLFLWIASIPLGYFAGLVWNWPPYAVYLCLRIDFIIKSFWCIHRLNSQRWIKNVYELGNARNA